MRYIDTSSLKNKLPKGWQEKADDVLTQLKAAASPDERRKIIAKKSTLWGELKETLKELSHGKCWYTESKNDGSYDDVDHFRPKGKVDENSDHPGYWWLAFDYKNYRFSCKVSNTSGKREHFPLEEGCTHVTACDGDLDTEIFLLLDPTIEDDPKLLAYREDGSVIPNFAEGTFEYKRATTTIEQLYLNFPKFCKSRKEILTEIEDTLQVILAVDLDPEKCRSLLQKYLSDKKPYSAFSASMLSKKIKSYPELTSFVSPELVPQ
jgi:uncharacterized protein (TIGR02646 family)